MAKKYLFRNVKVLSARLITDKDAVACTQFGV